MQVNDGELRNLLAVQEDWQALLGMAGSEISLREALQRMPSMGHWGPPSVATPNGHGEPSWPTESSFEFTPEGMALKEIVHADALQAERCREAQMEPPEPQPPLSPQMVPPDDADIEPPADDYHELRRQYEAAARKARSMEQSLDAVVSDWRLFLVRPSELEALMMIQGLVLQQVQVDLAATGEVLPATKTLIEGVRQARPAMVLALSELLKYLGWLERNEMLTPETKILLSNVRAAGLGEALR